MGTPAKVKVGIIGAGMMGQQAHLANYALIKNCEVVALAELRCELRRQVCERYKIKKGYATHQEMLKDPQVQAVVVVTKRPMLGPIALDCLKAGKHVIAEKPMAASVEQAEILAETAKNQKVCYAVGYMRRHDEGVQQAKKILDGLIGSKELGPVVFVRSHCFQGDFGNNFADHIVTDEPTPAGMPGMEGWPIAPDWVPADRKLDYAWVNNVYCHNLNLLRFLLGRTPSVDFARVDHGMGRTVVLDFGGYSAVAELGYSSSRKWDELVEIHFEHGCLRIELPPNMLRNVPAKITLYKQGAIQEIISPQINWSWAFRRQAEAFIRDIQENRPSLASGRDAIEDIRLLEEIWKKELNRTQTALV